MPDVKISIPRKKEQNALRISGTLSALFLGKKSRRFHPNIPRTWNTQVQNQQQHEVLGSRPVSSLAAALAGVSTVIKPISGVRQEWISLNKHRITDGFISQLCRNSENSKQPASVQVSFGRIREKKIKSPCQTNSRINGQKKKSFCSDGPNPIASEWCTWISFSSLGYFCNKALHIWLPYMDSSYMFCPCWI